MKYLNQLLLVAALAASICAPALAQQTQAVRPEQASTAAEAVEGEVRKVDKSAGKITLKHGKIRNLEMPPMTMVFGVSDPAMLDKVNAGDKVRFRAANQGGKMTITDIQITQ